MLKNKINEKIYIGQTIRSIEKRFEEHQKKTSGCVAMYNAIQKYGWVNFEKDWYECPDEDLNFDEELLVREMGTLAPGGYNLKEGGSNGKLSEETKQKISEAQRGDKGHWYGKILNDGHKTKISEALIGKFRTEESKQKISEAKRGEKNPSFGKIPSEETKQKMSEAKVGKQKSEETKQKMSEAQRGEKSHMYGKIGEKHHRSKKVYQYDLDGNFVRSFGSSGEAALYIKKDSSNIKTCARGKCKTAYGFKWYHFKY